MAKTSKRSKKFVAKGGVKSMLDKGNTFTKKGKVRTNKRRGDGGGGDRKPDRRGDAHGGGGEEQQRRRLREKQRRDEEDLAGGEANLGDLDLDGFFRSVADASDDDDASSSDGGDGGGDEDMMSDGDGSDGSDSDGDSDGDEDDVDGSSSDDGGDDDSDDLEAAERSMRAEMGKLSKSDPEFHKYLKDNEESLLEFGESDDDDGDDDEGDSDDDAMEQDGGVERPTKKTRKEASSKEEAQTTGDADSPYIRLTPKLLRTYEQSAFKSHGVKGLRRIVSAYKAACHLSDATPEDGQDGDRGKKSYDIDDSAVYDRLMLVCLTRCHGEFQYHLLGDGSGGGKDAKGEKGRERTTTTTSSSGDRDEEEEAGLGGAASQQDENKPLNPKLLAKSRRWKDVQPILQSFLKSTLHILSEAKEPELLTFVLKSLSAYVPYLTALPRVAKATLKSLTNLWSASLDTSEDYQVVRLNAFLRIRQLALTQPFPFIEDCLKSTYLAYAKRAKFATAATVTSLLPTLTFMGNCVVELYSLDYASSYQHAFVYVRQLALHLRTALQKKTPEAFRAVYCWQYVHCLKLWTAVLCSACVSEVQDDEARLMRSLIFPLTEVIFGVVRLVPTTRHLPLRLHCVRLLQQIAASAELYVPTTSVLLEVLDLKELYLKPKRVETRGRDVRGIRLPLILKLPKDGALRTAEQLDACLGEVFFLLNREVDLYRYSAGFPEFTVRICQRLRKFSKETKNGRYRAYSRGCIELCDKYSAEAVAARSKLEEAPKDVKRLEVLRGHNVPSMRERYEASVAKEKRLEAASQPAVSESARKKADAAAERQRREEAAEKKSSKSKKQAKKKQKREVNEADLKNVGALEEEDEVQEGIDWDSDNDDAMDDV